MLQTKDSRTDDAQCSWSGNNFKWKIHLYSIAPPVAKDGLLLSNTFYIFQIESSQNIFHEYRGRFSNNYEFPGFYSEESNSTFPTKTLTLAHNILWEIYVSTIYFSMDYVAFIIPFIFKNSGLLSLYSPDYLNS